MTDISVKIGTYTDLGAAADELRHRIFIEEQGVPEDEVFDGLSEHSIHIVIFDGEIPIATTRLFQNDKSWKIGLVAVDRSRRGQHLGKKVMQTSIDYISLHGGEEIQLSAQQQASGFYNKLGFNQYGDKKVFESGFVLVPMKLFLSPPVD